MKYCLIKSASMPSGSGIAAVCLAIGLLPHASVANLAVTVTDTSGALISEALVSLYSTAQDWNATSVAGRFRFDDVPEGIYELEVTRPGFVTQSVERVQFVGTSMPITVTMEVCNNACSTGCEPRPISYEGRAPGGGLVRGVIMTQDVGKPDKPLAGATVSFSENTRGQIHVSAKSNKRGEFDISRLPPGKYQVRAESVGYFPVIMRDLRILSDRTAVIRLSTHPIGAYVVCQ